MLRILICWHFENEQPVTCGYNITLTNILIMQIEKHGRFNYHRSNHWSSLITLGLFIHIHISIPLTFPIMQDSPQTPADITNSNSIPASLGHACNKTLRGWRDKWVSKVEDVQQQESRASEIIIRLSYISYLHIYIHWLYCRDNEMCGKEPHLISPVTHMN